MHSVFASETSDRKQRCFGKPGMPPDSLGLEMEENYSVCKVLEHESKISVPVDDKKQPWHCPNDSARSFNPVLTALEKTF